MGDRRSGKGTHLWLPSINHALFKLKDSDDINFRSDREIVLKIYGGLLQLPSACAHSLLGDSGAGARDNPALCK